ncbi:MAG TPA: formylglycine-generating enzyme family protein [Spirochaetota bacterium]|nr:formylglycine-generating enzyme family protein [Spirochaetota bacterium]
MKRFITVSAVCALLLTAVLVETEPAVDSTTFPGIEMVLIKSGKFTMGSTLSGADYSPPHTVNITAFRMSKYEITQKIYADVTGQRPCAGSKYGEGDLLPVYNVSWYDAVEFCNKLSSVHGLKAYYNIVRDDIDPANISPYDPVKWEISVNSKADGFRLPTEAQWEYACRGGTSTRFYWGKSASWDVSGRYSWHMFNTGVKRYRDNQLWWVKYHKVQKTGGRKANAFGLYDMCGNVSEWCYDRYDVSFYTAAELTDPTGWNGDYSYRVFRGGSVLDSPADFSSYRRWAMGAFEKQHTTGIRLVLPE